MDWDEFVAVEVSFPSGASHHQRARPHEARPKSPDPGDKLLGVIIGAGHQILIDDEEGLDGADVLAVVDDEVAVVETVLERVFDEFVEAMILALAGERGPPAQ